MIRTPALRLRFKAICIFSFAAMLVVIVPHQLYLVQYNRRLFKQVESSARRMNSRNS